MQFIGTTAGLMATFRNSDRGPKLARVNFSRMPDGSIFLQTVSGRNLAKMPGTKTIPAADYENRPAGYVQETEWALALCGWEI